MIDKKNEEIREFMEVEKAKRNRARMYKQAEEDDKREVLSRELREFDDKIRSRSFNRTERSNEKVKRIKERNNYVSDKFEEMSQKFREMEVKRVNDQESY